VSKVFALSAPDVERIWALAAALIASGAVEHTEDLTTGTVQVVGPALLLASVQYAKTRDAIEGHGLTAVMEEGGSWTLRSIDGQWVLSEA